MAENIIPKNDATNALTDFASVGGSGMENVTASDLLIPRLTIVQGLSPQIVKGKPEYDENAKVGDIYDVGLHETFHEGIEIIPVHYEKAWLQWAPRQSGKGLIAIHHTDDILRKAKQNEKRQYFLGDDLIVETAQFYALNLTTPEMRKSFIPMSSTQLKKARHLLTLAQSERVALPSGDLAVPPLFWRSYFLTTVPESNAMGNWMGWKVTKGPRVDERPDWKAILSEVKMFREAITTGRARGDLAGDQQEGEATKSSDMDDKVPF